GWAAGSSAAAPDRKEQRHMGQRSVSSGSVDGSIGRMCLEWDLALVRRGVGGTGNGMVDR
ncbi:hypothetical protein LTR28_011722, partial [Elasticomyces elasticus]